ncbi:hypothetical protein JHK87_042485 [Glycine soja]|nr:hypothetical protein JHK87_042485 [Glycine soja]
MSFLNASSPRYAAESDIEAGTSARRSADLDDGDFSDPFDIARTKNASVERLRRWRQAALVLNASRRFRYTLDLKKEEEKKQILRKIRAHAQAIRVRFLQLEFLYYAYARLARYMKCSNYQFCFIRQLIFSKQLVWGQGVVKPIKPPPIPTAGEFPIGQEQLASISREHDTAALQQYGGMFMWDACKDLTLVILMVAAAASLALGIKSEVRFTGKVIFNSLYLVESVDSGLLSGIKEGWYDGGSIAFAVILVIVVTAISDYKQSLQFRDLNEEKRNIHLEVVRGGRRVEISIYDIVVGDVIPLNIGNQVPADGILITGHSLAIDESSMTGESKIVHKDSKDPFLMSGCKVADGSGTMLVTGVGINTEWGLLMASISEDTGEETPLQWEFVSRYFSGHTKNPDGSVQFIAGKTKVGDAIDGAIKIITVAVRRLSACETMGSATTICSDKTGTLTMNQMTVVEAYAGGKKIDPPHKLESYPMLRSLLIEGVAQNTNGSVYAPEGANDVEVSGSPTEKAILQWGIQADCNIHIHWKGAAEIVLACCTGYVDVNDQLVGMDEEKMTFFKKAIEDMAADSLRCVAIAYRSYEKEKVPTNEELLSHWSLPEDDLILLAIVGLKDPCRPGVKQAVELCQKAGVKVKMVTGDNVKTAKAIALECGILNSYADATEPNIIEGKTFRGYSDAQRDEIADRISVMGRSSPNDKLLLVQALRRKGHVVAVTGDGTNDAPALHEADIGLAMGIQGTEVAKESSDIIILDDNFASVVKVVRWGRSVYANIQKFIQFQLTVNVAALVINVVAAISSGDVPLNAVQLLWVNLIMDTLGALALATEPPTDHLMDRSPVGRRTQDFFPEYHADLQNLLVFTSQCLEAPILSLMIKCLSIHLAS